MNCGGLDSPPQFYNALVVFLSKQILLRSQGIFRSIEDDLAVFDNGEAFHAAWAKGQRMKMQEAIGYALALPGA